jgi:hypothetical protein
MTEVDSEAQPEEIVDADLVDLAGVEVLDADLLNPQLDRLNERGHINGPRVVLPEQMARTPTTQPQNFTGDFTDDAARVGADRLSRPGHRSPPFFCSSSRRSRSMTAGG